MDFSSTYYDILRQVNNSIDLVFASARQVCKAIAPISTFATQWNLFGGHIVRKNNGIPLLIQGRIPLGFINELSSRMIHAVDNYFV